MTGSLNPIHRSHISNLETVKKQLEQSNPSWHVLAGYLSPTPSQHSEFRPLCYTTNYTHKFEGHSVSSTQSTTRNFTIVGNDFMKDGQPYRIIAGSIHYWRSLPQDWNDRLTLIKRLGCNTITTYIWWALHEPEDGTFVFDKPEYDFVSFIQLAQSLDLLVIVRVGPYITAEVDLGGFPYWIMKLQHIAIRRPNEVYYQLIDRYFDQLIPRLAPLQYHLGGSIIDFQVEDDSDVPLISFDDTHSYYGYLRDGLIKRGIQSLISTLASPNVISLRKAVIPNAWTALEYQIQHSTPDALALLRKHAPDHNPFMVMEYYPGWIDYEGQSHHTIDSEQFAEGVDKIFSYNGSVNFYMVFGGTNFQFTNGGDRALAYHSIITSYDYDAMIIECGDAHQTKFKAVRDVIAKYVPLPPMPTPSPSPKGLYGTMQFNSRAQLIENLHPFNVLHNIDVPIQFEYLNQSYGYILYSTQLKDFTGLPEPLLLPWMQDRAVVLLDELVQGVIGWTETDPIALINLHPIKMNPNPRLDILVENKGRCCGEIPDLGCSFKGMKDKPWLGLKQLGNWTITKLPMDDQLSQQSTTFNWQTIPPGTSIISPSFYRSTFTIDMSKPLHSFLCTDNWGYGFIIINGFNLGRYSEKGPQRTMYVPAHILKQGINEILVFESDRRQPSFSMRERNMTFMDHQLWTN
ncbi:unnamed protein product [Rotaria sp. Silwood1]|nr:unnamed protein product [Rotaria sp. Silwood1]CAF1403841.1 unnamed protein product [Rotaria sp. Silwood1]